MSEASPTELRASFLKRLLCDWLGWHRVPQRSHFDGVSNVGWCARCNRRCLQDSQGNWFDVP